MRLLLPTFGRDRNDKIPVENTTGIDDPKPSPDILMNYCSVDRVTFLSPLLLPFLFADGQYKDIFALHSIQLFFPQP